MKKPRLIVSSLAVLSLVTVSACVTDPNPGEQKVSRTAIGGVGGAALGYLLGGLIGGKTARIVGAGIGGVAGGVVGYKMDQQIKELKESTAGSGIDVMGHTDSTGSDAHNLDLSRRRAESVANHLVSRGINRARIATIGYGKQYPIADNTTVEGRALNRRVEIRITPISQDDVNAAR